MSNNHAEVESPPAEAPPTAAPAQRYRCKKGHVSEDLFLYTSTNAQTGELEASSGPMCRVCLLEWAGQKFRATPVASVNTGA